MSDRGNCYDNAAVECFFGLLKRERVNRVRYRTRDEARTDVFDYIERFNNRQRPHAYLGHISDEQTYGQYRQKVKPIIEKYGGKYVIRAGTKFVSDNPTSRLLNTSGDWNPDRIIVLHFYSAEQFQSFLNASEYKDIVHLRTSSSSMKSLLVGAFLPDE